MKAKIPPRLQNLTVTCSVRQLVGHAFDAGQRPAHRSLLACHPFYTGKQKIVRHRRPVENSARNTPASPQRTPKKRHSRVFPKQSSFAAFLFF